MIYPLDYIRITQYPHKNNNLSVDFGKERKVSKTPILACDDGVVKRVEYQKTGGNVVFIDFNSGYRACYGHLKNYIVKQNQKVKQGQIIGYMGQTGIATGPHLHFGLYDITTNINYGNAKYNPLKILTVASNQRVDAETEEKYHLKYEGTNNDKKELYVTSVDEEGLIIRNKPNGTATGQTLKIGSKVVIYDTSSSWSRVGDNQWVYSAYLSDKEPKTYKVSSKANGGLNVRNMASIKGNLIKTLDVGTKVAIYDTKNGWAKISPTENKWVSKNYLV